MGQSFFIHKITYDPSLSPYSTRLNIEESEILVGSKYFLNLHGAPHFLNVNIPFTLRDHSYLMVPSLLFLSIAKGVLALL